MITPELANEIEKLINTNPELLSGLEKQKRYICQVESADHPCPNCDMPISIFDASPNTLTMQDIGHVTGGFICPNCSQVLKQDVYAFGGDWGWSKVKQESH